MTAKSILLAHVHRWAERKREIDLELTIKESSSMGGLYMSLCAQSSALCARASELCARTDGGHVRTDEEKSGRQSWPAKLDTTKPTPNSTNTSHTQLSHTNNLSNNSHTTLQSNNTTTHDSHTPHFKTTILHYSTFPHNSSGQPVLHYYFVSLTTASLSFAKSLPLSIH